jgi:hypothetical protein
MSFNEREGSNELSCGSLGQHCRVWTASSVALRHGIERDQTSGHLTRNSISGVVAVSKPAAAACPY